MMAYQAFPMAVGSLASTETGGVASKTRTEDTVLHGLLARVIQLLGLSLKHQEIITDTELDESDVRETTL